MAIKKEKKNQILIQVDAGIPVQELADEYKISKGTIWAWLRKRKKEGINPNETIDNIKKQIATLAKRKATEAVSRKIAMLTSALAKLERREDRKEVVASKVKPMPTVVSTEEAEELKKRALDGEFGELFEYQKEFMQSTEIFRLVIKSRQIGFSYIGALDALIGAVAGRNQLFLSASEEQALILMRYVEHWAEKMSIVFTVNKDNEKRLSNGAIIKAMANNFRTVQGFTGDIWMDEFAWYQNPQKIWRAFVPSIGAIGGRLTIMSTPFEEPSLFHQLVTDELKYYMFKRFRIDIYRAMKDGLKFDLETMRALFDAESWASGYECQFVDDESALFPIALIKSCVNNKLFYRTPNPNKVQFAGFDIGRTTHKSALAGLELIENKYSLITLDLLHKATFEEQETHIFNYLDVNRLAQMNIDKSGIGMDLAERTKKKYKQRVKGTYFTPSSKEAIALNLKKMFEDKIIEIPNDSVLIADIHSIKRRASGKRFLYDSKANEHGHADRFWGLALGGSFINAIERKKGGKGRGIVLGG